MFDSKKYKKQYYLDNIDKKIAYRKTDKCKQGALAILQRRLASWLIIIPEVTFCERCGTKIYYNAHDKLKSISFDCRNIEAGIKVSPYDWLRLHYYNPKNLLIWKNSNMGCLCHNCRRVLPNVDREKIIVNRINYFNQINEIKQFWTDRRDVSYHKIRYTVRDGYLLSWKGYIPSIINCQCCGKKLYFSPHDQMKAIHFDHFISDIFLSSGPTGWLRGHAPTPEKRLIWEKCYFGMLCKSCNRTLPTHNRRESIILDIKYIHTYNPNFKFPKLNKDIKPCDH